MEGNDCTLRDPVAQAVESLLRSIPERWAEFDHDALTAAEQQALMLLVAAGLVERRFSLRVEMAGQPGAIEATAQATGDRGLVEALDPFFAELWSQWGEAFKAWTASEAAESSPFRVMLADADRWRLTEHGVMARADLDVEAPTPAAAAVVGCRQRTLEFVLRAGRQRRRPSVDGRGCLVSLRKAPEEAAAGQTPQATPVALTNADAVAEAFRKALLPVIVETFQRRSVDRPKAPGEGMPIEEVVRKAGRAFRWTDDDVVRLLPTRNSGGAGCRKRSAIGAR